VDLKSNRVVGFEALVRWMHPQRGLIPPVDFIAVAEDTGLIVPIGTWMLQAACSQLVQWLRRFPSRTDLSMNVNMSVRHLRQPNIVEQVLQTLKETGLAAERLKLEVTESMLMENAVTQVDVLRRLRAIGVGVAIDDFGTGYSSLSYLQRFPIDALKIDRSFIAQDTRSDNWEIVRMILALARDKRALTVAEGVESEDQARDLRNLGCDRAQGYLYGRPLEADVAAQMLAR
jgi:Amt family ammonium transporter